jgi:large subunit ribosomal protein L15
MNELSKLSKPAGSTKRRKRVGRGQASGLGKTAGRGGKGQKARTGNMHFEGFEGGQSPLQRRLPKRGFTNIHRQEFEIVNLESLSEFPAGTTLDVPKFLETGLVNDTKRQIKVLGDGELTVALTVHAHKFSASAKSKIEAAGGKAELIVTLKKAIAKSEG